MSTLIGLAGDFDGATVLRRTDVSALAGLANFTLRCLILPNQAMISSDHGWLCVNTPTGVDSPAALMLAYVSTSGTDVDMIKAKVRTAAGNAFIHSTSSRQAAARQLIHAVFADGQIPKLYLDGVDVSGTISAIQTGAMVLDTGGLFLGAGPQDTPSGGWQGLIDEMALIVGAHTPARVAAEAKSWNTPSRFYAIGGENVAGDANLAPVAPPMEIAATVGVQTADVDVAANGIDPGGGALTVAGTPTSDNGTVSLVANKLRGTVSTSGLATWLYILQEPGGKTCGGSVFVTAEGGEPPPPSDLPKLQPAVAVGKWHCVGFDTPGRKATYAAGRAGFAAAVAAANLVAGDVIVLADGTYSGAFIDTLGKSGAASADGHNHIMVRARNHGMAIVDHQLQVHGEYWWFTGIKFTYNAAANPNYSTGDQAILSDQAGLWVTNCMFTGYAFIHIYPRASTTNLRICYNTVAATTLTTGTDTGVFITMHNYTQTDRPPPDSEIAWNRVTLGIRANAGGEGHSRNILILHPSHSTSIGNQAFVQRGFTFHHNHCVGPWSEIIYCKRNIWIEFNYFEWTNGLSQFDFTFRHGLLSSSPQYDVGGVFRGNLLKSSGKAVTLELNGVGITVACNRLTGAGGEIRLFAGAEHTSGNPQPRDAADMCQVVDNLGFGTVTVGNLDGDLLDFRGGAVNGTRIFLGDRGWNPVISHESGSSVSGSPFAGYGTGTAVKVTTIAEPDLTDAGCDPMP